MPQQTNDTVATVQSDIRYVRLQWTNMAGKTCYRVIPISQYRKLLESSRPSISIARAVLGLALANVASGFSPVGEYAFVLDPSSAAPSGYASNTLIVTGWFEEKVPIPSLTGGMTVKVALCARTLLGKILQCVFRVHC
jgi:hypothetical protein